MSELKRALAVVILATLAVGVVFALRLFVKLRFPAQIPADLAFEGELRSDKPLRAVAEALAARFPGPTVDNVVCLGPVRGNAARVLFHSGPNNPGRRREIHRPDYLLVLRRVGEARVALRLETRRPYSYLRIRRSEVEPLVRALRDAYGSLTTL